MTIVVVPTLSGKLVNVSLINQSSGGTFLQNTNARVKAVNGIVGSTNVNFKIDNAPILVNVPFAAGSNYVTTVSGSHTLQVEQSNVPGTNVATLPVNTSLSIPGLPGEGISAAPVAPSPTTT